MVGTEFASRYRIERALGQGGMGRVFAALDQKLGRHVAIKVIRDDLDDPIARQRFFREARAAAALSHPNACQLYEVGADESQPFLVMELLEGESLSSRLERGPLTIEQAVAVLGPLMDALTALHRAGIVHRDLKPSNVFLTPQGVKLLDFGLARRTQRADHPTASALTVPGAVTGTMRYMAPEQILGDPVDARTDVFALGVMLFEMVTGRIPFDAETNVDWLQAVLHDDPPGLEQPELQVLDPIVTRALQRRLDDRYDDVDQMAAALIAAVGSEAAPTPTAPRRESGPRLAILPFRLLQDDLEIAVLEHGLPEALTVLMSTAPDLRLLSNRVAQPFGDDPDLVAVAATLHADRLLTGSVLRVGADVRLTAQLIDGADGAVLWSQTIEHTMTTILALQDDLSHQIVEGLLAQGLGQPSHVS